MIRRGFTIIELLIVLTIMGILLILGVVNLRSSQINARDAERKADIEAISLGLEAFYRTGADNTVTLLRYPSVLIADGTGAQLRTVFRDLNFNALTPPGAQSAASAFLAATNNDQSTGGVQPQPTFSTYIYQPLQNDGSLCINGNLLCETYNLFYRLESDNTVYKVQSKNRGGNPGSTPTVNPLTQGLVGWWPLNNSATNVISGSTGDISGAIPTTGQNGLTNNAYSFDGVDDFIEIQPVLNSFSSFTISAWAKGIVGSGTDPTIGYILHKGVEKIIGTSVYHIAATGAYYRADVSGAGSLHNLGVIPSLSQWRLITITYTGGQKLSYVDGVQIISESRAFTVTTLNTRETIGSSAYEPNYRPFKGSIDDVRIYNRALSASEVAQLYTQGAQ